MEIVQVVNDGDGDQSGDKWVDLGYVMNVELVLLFRFFLGNDIVEKVVLVMNRVVVNLWYVGNRIVRFFFIKFFVFGRSFLRSLVQEER